MSDVEPRENNAPSAAPAANPLLVVGGFMILGIVLMLILFGGNLRGGSGSGEDTAVLPQVPALSNSGALPQTSGANDPVTVGSTAYDFVLSDLEGRDVQLSSFRGQPVIINFWATWCAPCRIEMPELEAAHAQYAPEGLVILALNQQEDPADVRAFFYDEMGLSFTPLLDSDGTIQELYGLSNILPTTFFVNREGVVTAVHRGPLTTAQIDGYVAETVQ